MGGTAKIKPNKVEEKSPSVQTPARLQEDNSFFIPASTATKTITLSLRSSTLKKELIETKQMEAAGRAYGLEEGEIAGLKFKYTRLIETVVSHLANEGYKTPANLDELKSLMIEISSLVWSNTPNGYALTSDLVEAMQKGTLDCDTSSFVFAEVLEQMGIKTRIIDVAISNLPVMSHAIVQAGLPSGKSTFMETTTGAPPQGAGYAALYNFGIDLMMFHDSKESVEKLYAQIVGDYAFETRAILAKISALDEDGLPACNKAIAIDPRATNAYSMRAGIYRNMGKKYEALADLSKLFQLLPNDPQPRIDRAIIYFESNENYKALTEINTLLGKTKPVGGIADYAVPLMFGTMPRTSTPQAYEQCLWIRAPIYQKLEKYDESLADLNTLVTLSPRGTSAREELARLYLEHFNDPDKALWHVNAAIAFAPEDPASYVMRGRIFEKLGNKKDAKKDFEKADALVKNQQQ